MIVSYWLLVAMERIETHWEMIYDHGDIHIVAHAPVWENKNNMAYKYGN